MRKSQAAPQTSQCKAPPLPALCPDCVLLDFPGQDFRIRLLLQLRFPTGETPTGLNTALHLPKTRRQDGSCDTASVGRLGVGKASTVLEHNLKCKQRPTSERMKKSAVNEMTLTVLLQNSAENNDGCLTDHYIDSSTFQLNPVHCHA